MSNAAPRRLLPRGIELLAQLPHIRKEIRYRSARWEMLQRNALWKVCEEKQVLCFLKSHYSIQFRGTKKAEHILDALYNEGLNVESEEPNRVLLSRPDLTEFVRKELMPLVQQCFCFHASRFYEWKKPDEWPDGHWSPVTREWENCSIRCALRDQFRENVSAVEAEACIEELKLEGRK